MIVQCEFCGNDYKTFKNWYNRNKHHCCSRTCSEQLKKKLSTKTCSYCQKPFYSENHQKDKKFCSIACSRNYKKENPKLHVKTCGFCETTFAVRHLQINKVYCSTECRNMSRFKRIGRTCLECGASLLSSRKKFCGTNCFVKFRDKNSTKKKCVCTRCGDEFLRNPGEIKKAMRHFCSHECRLAYNRGKNHYEWKDLNHDFEYKDRLRKWAKAVKERDGYLCQKCGCDRLDRLNAHHKLVRELYP